MSVVRSRWIALGTALVAIHCVLAILSADFAWGADPLSLPIVPFVALEILAGVIYLGILWLVPRSRGEPGLLMLVLGVGIAMRALGFLSTPILEDDFYRYLWDGAVVAAGEDPYRYPPATVLEAGPDAPADLATLAVLAEDSGSVAARINHPWLTTIYPPLAQAAFALSARIDAFGLLAWRGLLLGFEIATVVVLFLILLYLRRSPLWLAVYWWNPLVVKELSNSAHMDALLLPFLAAIVLLALLGKRTLASVCVALAAGIKLWPVLLLPTVLRPLLGEPRRLVAPVAAFLAAFSVTALWIHDQAGGDTGLTAFSTSWNMNDASFRIFHWMTETALGIAGADWVNTASVTRAVVAALVIALSLLLNRRVAREADELCTRFLVVTAIVFLFSPAQFPWYYTWLVPFLVVVPSPALLLLTALLPLYYLRFYLDIRDEARIFDLGVVWIEYLPVWLLLAREWWLQSRARDARA